MPNRLGDIQKARLEVANFENFLHLGSITFDRYQSQEPPEPDIIAWRDGAAFGIELTNFHRQREKQIESEEDRVLERALAIYNSRRGPSLLLSLRWAPHFKVCQTVREEIAEKIATLALNNTPPPNQWIILDWNQFDRQLMCAVDHIALYASPEGVPAHWDTGRGAVVQSWDFPSLQQELDRKKEKPKKFRRQYHETWLLIVSEFGTPSSWMEMNDPTKNSTFISSFDKVFLLSSFPLQVVELQLSDKSI